MEAIRKFAHILKDAHPIVHNCDEINGDCGERPMIFEFPLTTMGVNDEDFLYVYSVPFCWVPELPTPYLENKIIKTCLTASASAKRIAQKAIKENTEGVFNNFDEKKSYTCQHMLLGNNGTAKVEKHKCVDFNEGTNLVRCFFEIHSEFQFSVNYRCFYPELWESWYLSFKRVYIAMKTKGYLVTTDNLQQRYCRVQRNQMCIKVLSHRNGKCGTYDNIKKHCQDGQYCNNNNCIDEKTNGTSAASGGKRDYDYEKLGDYFEICKHSD